MNRTVLNGGYVRAVADQVNPFQTNIEFVFTDFAPNKNKQAVPRSEAENIIRTGLNMPIKANFTGTGVRGHGNALPIGPITALEQKGDVVVGHAIIWKSEFPELTDYLEKASASDNGVQFSWELFHKQANVDDQGVSWLQDCIVAGAAIVADPAYAGRTPLLSFAEEDIAEQLKNIAREVSELKSALANGSQSMEPVEELKQQFETFVKSVNDQLAALQPASTEADTANVDQTDVEKELAELRAYKQTAEDAKARAELLATRRTSLKDIISDEDFTAKADFIAGLAEDQFTAYVESLSAVASRSKSSAAVDKDKKNDTSYVPDPLNTGAHSQQVSTAELAKALRSLNK